MQLTNWHGIIRVSFIDKVKGPILWSFERQLWGRDGSPIAVLTTRQRENAIKYKQKLNDKYLLI